MEDLPAKHTKAHRLTYQDLVGLVEVLLKIDRSSRSMVGLLL